MKKRRSRLTSLEDSISYFIKPMLSNKGNFLIINNIVKNWEKIVGKYSQFCYPMQINFSDKTNQKATLTIAVYQPNIATELSWVKDQILERISSLYGHQAISKIIIKQEPKKFSNHTKENNFNLTNSQTKFIEKNILSIKNQDLADSLSTLGKLILEDKKNIKDD